MFSRNSTQYLEVENRSSCTGKLVRNIQNYSYKKYMNICSLLWDTVKKLNKYEI